MSGTRMNGIVDQPTVLQFNFLKNGILYDPEEITKVEIYDNYDSANSDSPATGDILFTINSSNITRINLGTYQVTVPAIADPNTYFDKWYVIPEPGYAVRSFIHSFYIRLESYGSTIPSDHKKYNVYVNIFDIKGIAQSGATVKVKMSVSHAFYNNDSIIMEEEMYIADSDGLVNMSLIETQTLSESTFPLDTGEERTLDTCVYYIVNISGKYTKKIYIPRDLPSGSVSIDDLSSPEEYFNT